MKRRPISDEDVEMIKTILRSWDSENDGPLSWKGLLENIRLDVGYLYERTSLYKAKGGVVYKEFNVAKERLKDGNKGGGETMSRQTLVKAYKRQAIEIEELRMQNTKLLQLHSEYLKLFFERDVVPPFIKS